MPIDPRFVMPPGTFGNKPEPFPLKAAEPETGTLPDAFETISRPDPVKARADPITLEVGNASLRFASHHNGKLRTLDIEASTERAPRGDRVFGPMTTIARIVVSRREAEEFLTKMAQLSGSFISGGNGDRLEFGWDGTMRHGLGVNGGWCLMLKRQGSDRALRRFPLNGPSEAQALAAKLIALVNADQDAP